MIWIYCSGNDLAIVDANTQEAAIGQLRNMYKDVDVNNVEEADFNQFGVAVIIC